MVCATVGGPSPGSRALLTSLLTFNHSDYASSQVRGTRVDTVRTNRIIEFATGPGTVGHDSGQGTGRPRGRAGRGERQRAEREAHRPCPVCVAYAHALSSLVSRLAVRGSSPYWILVRGSEYFLSQRNTDLRPRPPRHARATHPLPTQRSPSLSLTMPLLKHKLYDALFARARFASVCWCMSWCSSSLIERRWLPSRRAPGVGPRQTGP